MSYLNYSPDAISLYYRLIFENQQWDIPNINYGNFHQVSIIQSEDIRILEGPLCFETVGINKIGSKINFLWKKILTFMKKKQISKGNNSKY